MPSYGGRPSDEQFCWTISLELWMTMHECLTVGMQTLAQDQTVIQNIPCREAIKACVA